MSIFCGSRCQDRKDKKLELKYEKKLAKIDASVTKVEAKQETKAIAYQNDIDPNASKWNAISSMVGSVAGAASNVLSPGGSLFSSGPNGTVAGSTGPANNKPKQGGDFPWWILLVGGGLLLIFNKK